MAAKGIARLPEEILLQIFTYLQRTLKIKSWKPCCREANAKYQSLARVCRVSRLFRRIATPLLYHTVELPPCEKAWSTHSEAEVHTCHVKRFFRSVLNDHGLALLVRQVKVDYHGSQETNPRVYDDRSTDFLQSSIKALCADSPLEEDLRDDIVKRAAFHYDDGMLVILLHLFENTAYIDITVHDSPKDFINSLLMRGVTQTSASLEADAADYDFIPLTLKMKYTHPTSGFEGMRRALNLADIAPLLRLQCLKDVRIRGIGGLDWRPLEEVPKSLQPRLSTSLGTLHLWSSMLDGREIAEALAAFPRLWEFKYTQREASLFDPDHDAVFEALRQHCKKLRVLQFHAVNVGGPPGDLKPLARLKELSVSQRSLLGAYDMDIPLTDLPDFAEILPESLTKVKIIPYRRSYPLSDPFAPPLLEDEWDAPKHALTDFGEAFDDRICRLCNDQRFRTLCKVTLRRSQEIEVGLVPKGWMPEVDDNGWVRLRRGNAETMDADPEWHYRYDGVDPTDSTVPWVRDPFEGLELEMLEEWMEGGMRLMEVWTEANELSDDFDEDHALEGCMGLLTMWSEGAHATLWSDDL